ncbi:MAG: F-type H+-transporting ATPase subunit gamma [Candidatus Peregrinibacteria bacterium Gr01-1014_25]|nr:MAG: F-type H+-transporting ATPase subunit gamma [Candidatus Peregrinibacteria bacterium Gr01-1014_25]
MARSLRDLRRKMKAIKSTRQVTKAMELVAASKMRRAVQNAQILRQYAILAWHILQRLSINNAGMHPYLEQRPAGRILCVVISSDRGLCGSLNTQLFRATTQYVQSVRTLSTFQAMEFVAVGRKGQQFLTRTGQSVIAAFPALSNHPTFKDALPITRFITESYLARKYDHVVLVYMDFISALVQEPAVKPLLPFSTSTLRDMIANLLPASRRKDALPSDMGSGDDHRKYIFEPSTHEVLDAVLPQLTEVQVYQAILESAASEHSARMVAMRNASDNASDILGDLTLTYNQTRQANITGELAELSAATAVMK